MAKKGKKKHLKRLNSPKVRKESKKEKKWTVSASPGPHSSDGSIPLSILLRENLKLARTTKEAEKILSLGEIQVDGKIRKNPKYPVGFMDVVKISKTNDIWRVIYNDSGYLDFYEIDEDVFQPL